MDTEYTYPEYSNCKVSIDGNYTFLYDENGELVTSIPYICPNREVGFGLLKAFFLGRRFGVNQTNEKTQKLRDCLEKTLSELVNL